MGATPRYEARPRYARMDKFRGPNIQIGRSVEPMARMTSGFSASGSRIPSERISTSQVEPGKWFFGQRKRSASGIGLVPFRTGCTSLICAEIQRFGATSSFGPRYSARSWPLSDFVLGSLTSSAKSGGQRHRIAGRSIGIVWRGSRLASLLSPGFWAGWSQWTHGAFLKAVGAPTKRRSSRASLSNGVKYGPPSRKSAGVKMWRTR